MHRIGPSTAKIFAATCFLILFGCNKPPGEPGHVLDEAKLAALVTRDSMIGVTTL